MVRVFISFLYRILYDGWHFEMKLMLIDKHQLLYIHSNIDIMKCVLFLSMQMCNLNYHYISREKQPLNNHLNQEKAMHKDMSTL